MNNCEHGDHEAPEGARFCSTDCAECERGTRECKWCAWEANPPDLGLAISVHAPWAWAIMHGGKDVENRSPGFPMRHEGHPILGRVWVHASMWPGAGPLVPYTRRQEDFDEACDAMAKRAALAGFDAYPKHRALGTFRESRELAHFDIARLRGHIVGSVEVHGCDVYAGGEGPASPSPWYVPGSLAIHLRDPRPLAKPVPAKGALGWWQVPEPVLETCREAA